MTMYYKWVKRFEADITSDKDGFLLEFATDVRIINAYVNTESNYFRLIKGWTPQGSETDKDRYTNWNLGVLGTAIADGDIITLVIESNDCDILIESFTWDTSHDDSFVTQVTVDDGGLDAQDDEKLVCW